MNHIIFLVTFLIQDFFLQCILWLENHRSPWTQIDETWSKCNSDVKENKESEAHKRTEQIKVQQLWPEISCRESVTI